MFAIKPQRGLLWGNIHIFMDDSYYYTLFYLNTVDKFDQQAADTGLPALV